MNTIRYRIEFYPCTHCGYKSEEKDDRDSGTWCYEYETRRDWVCGNCQIGKCKIKGIIDSIELD